MGLLLLSTLSAHDLGYIGPRRMVERLEKTFETLDRLEKHWGHFFNWYDTADAPAAAAGYVSTVDSGNLLGCLITLKHGLREKADAPLFGPAVLQGLADTFGLAAESRPPARRRPRRLAIADRQPRRPTWPTWDLWLESRRRAARDLAGRPDAEAARPATWADRLVEQAVEWQAELERLGRRGSASCTADDRGRPAALPRRDAARRWSSIREALLAPASLTAIVERADRLAAELSSLAAEAADPGDAERPARDRRGRARPPAGRAAGPAPTAWPTRPTRLADAMDFRPLYKPDRHLFAIGYNLVHGRLDNACYDLMASEAA